MLNDPHPRRAPSDPLSDPPPGPTPARPKVRLYLDHPLGPGQQVTLPEAAAHYLFAVMRLGAGDTVALFNGRDGEWAAELAPQGRRGGVALCRARVAPQGAPPDLWLVFAPLKKARMDMVVEKAVELGAARLIPVQTDFTSAERLRHDRLAAQVREAAEQCGATWVPGVDALRPLGAVLADWPAERALLWADEGAAGTAVPPLPPAPAGILIGPEGGFSAAERARLRARPGVRALPLGPRILRAETAALAALVLWQAQAGDWR